MRGVPWWGVVSAAAAPVLLVGGWSVAASLQPQFDPVADTVSALAAQGEPDRWVMTLTFVVVGVCYLLTALALRPAGTAGRAILITGAIAGMLVAANPESAGDAYPWGHIVWASIGLAGVTAWPAGAWRRGSAVPWTLRPAAAAAAVAVMLALVIWFAAELITGSGQVGLAERAAGVAQALWPLAVVLSCRRPVMAAGGPLPEPAPWPAVPEARPDPELGREDQTLWVHIASSAGAKCAMLGGGGIGEHEASAVAGGGGIAEHEASAVRGGGTGEQDASAVAGGGGIAEHEASAVRGGGGIGEHEATAVTGAGVIAEHEASAVTGGGGIGEQPCAVLGGGGMSDPEPAGRRALADAAWLAPDSISL